MRILHYSLGFPPYRSGGLTKFCVDLMNQQLRDGHIVSLLWPGQMLGKKVTIKEKPPVNGVTSFELINPLPVPYDEGIVEIEAFTKSTDKKPFIYFLREIHPDVIHIHTFMGLYDAFLDAAKELGIRTVFTTHDFFPICPKVTMYRSGKICDSAGDFEVCPQCNVTALSISRMKLLQSLPYRMLKDTKIVKKFRKQHRDEYLGEKTYNHCDAIRTKDDYRHLRDYYGNMLENIDTVHFNSTVTEKVYKDYLKIGDFKRISITHKSVKDNRKRKQYSNGILRIRYLGPQSGVKGFFLLRTALDELWKERKDFCLDVHFTPVKPSSYMRVHDRYGYEELEKIFDETDVLVAPSIWYETFGFTVLEALSFGVPVILSGTVGAKDILADGAGIVIEDISSEKLFHTIKMLRSELLDNMNKVILEKQHIITMHEMTGRIMEECYFWRN